MKMAEDTGLSKREREILQLIATGASNKEIARKLYISGNTIKVHLRNIFTKTGVSSRTEATLFAIREGLVQVERPDNIFTLESRPQNPAPRARPNRVLQFALVSLLAISLLVGLNLVTSFRQSSPVAFASPAPRVESRWKTRASLPSPRSNFGATAYENKIYAIAGESDGKVVATMDRYDPSNDAWEQLTPKPTAVAEVSAGFLGGRIYVPGGRLASGDVTNILEAYDPRADKWETHASLPIGLSSYALAVYEGKIYLFGGWNGNQYVATTYEYDPDADSWRDRTAMPTPRGFARAGISGGKILVIGGYDGTQALATNEQYSPDRDDGAQNPWSSRQALPSARYAMGIASIADFIYVIGGEGTPNTSLPPVQYSPQGNWQEFQVPASKVGSHLVLVPVQGIVYAMGGRNGEVTSAQNLAYQAIYTIFLPFGQ